MSKFRKRWPDVRIIAIPNGGFRDIRTAARLKAEGVTAGVPDLFIPEWRQFIEMKKARGGRVSPAQQDWIDYLHRAGYSVAVCEGHEAAMETAVRAARYAMAKKLRAEDETAG